MEIDQIQKRIALMEKYAKEIRDAKEMLKEELENDPNYNEVEQEAAEAIKKKKTLKDEILGKGPNQKLLDEIKANTEEISVLREILSAELVQIYKENDTDEITDLDGDPRKFKLSVKLLPKKGNFRNRDDFGKYVPGETGQEA